MNIKKSIIIIAAVTISVVMATMLILINVVFFRQVSPSLPEPKEKTMVEEKPATDYAIPASAMPPTTQESEANINKLVEKRKAFKERELEAARLRDARRAAAFAKQKELEAALLSAETQEPKQAPGPALRKKNANLPSEEEMKKLYCF